ncbi:MAG: inositol monophosphatase family protein, partial [Verrucomicrobiota bacterium]
LYWVVDPLDGTYNYLRAQPSTCVSLGLMRDPEAGGAGGLTEHVFSVAGQCDLEGRAGGGDGFDEHGPVGWGGEGGCRR